MTSVLLSHNYWRIWDAERTQHSTLGCKDEHDVTMLNLTWQSPTLRYRWFIIGSHALLDILMKYQKSMYITMKSKFTNLVLTTRNVKLTWKLGFSDVKWRVDCWSWKLICIYRHCVVKFEVDLREYQCWHDKLRCRCLKLDVALQLWFLAKMERHTGHPGFRG